MQSCGMLGNGTSFTELVSRCICRHVRGEDGSDQPSSALFPSSSVLCTDTCVWWLPRFFWRFPDRFSQVVVVLGNTQRHIWVHLDCGRRVLASPLLPAMWSIWACEPAARAARTHWRTNSANANVYRHLQVRIRGTFPLCFTVSPLIFSHGAKATPQFYHLNQS